jgi:hypothetical protein
MKIIRVFPSRTKATPVDSLSFVGEPPKGKIPDVDEVHISTIFTYDIPEAERLATLWQRIAPVKIGGPAFEERGGNFERGMYVKTGYTITSRGCPNRCWFCSVWKREGQKARELPIVHGWNVLDDNLLACSESHIRAVFKMLEQETNPVQFTGGFEAALLKPWHVDLLVDLKPAQMFFAYDSPKKYEPLVAASKLLTEAGFTRTTLRAFVLMGYKGDTQIKAESRCRAVAKLGFFPMAMLYRDKNGLRDKSWARFQRLWARPASIAAMLKAS